MRTSTAVHLKTLLHWALELPLDGQALHDHAARHAAIKLASVVNDVLHDEVTPAEIAEQWDQRSHALSPARRTCCARIHKRSACTTPTTTSARTAATATTAVRRTGAMG
jgi:hypothetical protein